MRTRRRLFIKKLPFAIGSQIKSDVGNLPDSLAFELEVDSVTGLIRQKYSKLVAEFLSKAYRQGSLLSTPLGKGKFGQRRADELLMVLVKTIKKPLGAIKVFELGCGDGYILRRLKSMGVKMTVGCDPGKKLEKDIRESGIKIYSDFFSARLLERKYDLIFSYGVLEHLYEPVKVIGEMMEGLRADGMVFAGVPNCEMKLKLGDPGILAHEHWNYFTQTSLKNVLTTAGLVNVETIEGKNGAMLYGWGSKTSLIYGESTIYADYQVQLRKTTRELQSRIDKLPGGENDLGLYGGGAQLKGLLKFKCEPRLFDGDSAKWGKYYAGFKLPIEPAENLKTKPVKELWIAATDYDKEIISFLRKFKLPGTVKIFSFRELENKLNLK